MTPELKQFCRRSFLAFCLKAHAAIKDRKLDAYQYLQLYAWILQKVADGELLRLLVSLPPGCGKTPQFRLRPPSKPDPGRLSSWDKLSLTPRSLA